MKFIRSSTTARQWGFHIFFNLIVKWQIFLLFCHFCHVLKNKQLNKLDFLLVIQIYNFSSSSSQLFFPSSSSRTHVSPQKNCEFFPSTLFKNHDKWRCWITNFSSLLQISREWFSVNQSSRKIFIFPSRLDYQIH